MPTPRDRTAPDEELGLLEAIGLIPSAVPADVLALLRERAAGGPVYRWEMRGRPRLAVFDPLLAAELARPRIHALTLPRTRDVRERRWASSFLAETVHGGGPRTTRLSEAAQHAWNSPHQINARERLLERLLTRYSPGALRPLGHDLRDHAHRLSVLWTEGREDEESARMLGKAVGGDEAAARQYRLRLTELSRGCPDCVLSGLDETDPEALADASLFSELAARVLGDLLTSMGRLFCGTRAEAGGPEFLERVLHDEPPWAIHVRETAHDYRLGIHRMPPRSRIFVAVTLLTAAGEAVSPAARQVHHALALGANLCPPLALLSQHALRLGEGFAAVGPLDPISSVRFIAADGTSTPDETGVHIH